MSRDWIDDIKGQRAALAAVQADAGFSNLANETQATVNEMLERIKEG